jgi:3-oxoadipate enol-lactonase
VTLPPGRHVELPGRGTTFVRELPGPSGAPTVLLLHGWTATADLTWFSVYARLGEHYRVLAMDNRGHGRGMRGARFTVDECADDAALLLDVLDVGQVIAAGYSLGGPIALQLWRRHPWVVHGLVLAATTACFAPNPRMRARLEMLGVLAAASRLLPDSAATKVAEQVLGTINRRRGLAPWVESELKMGDGRALLEAGHQIARWDARPWIGQVDVPTAVVVTEQDQLVPPANQRWMAGTIPNAAMLAVEGEHTVCVSNPERFAPVLLAAVGSVTGAGI